MPRYSILNNYRTGFLTIVLVAVANFSDGQTRPATNERTVLAHKIDSIIMSEVNEGKIPGAVIAVKKGDEIIYRNALGYAQKFDYEHQPLPKPEPMTTEHLFDIASLTKVVGTTTSIMLLADKGQVNVDDKVGKYIKAFTTPDKAGITIRHLLTHTAGLYEWYPLFYRASNKKETFRLIGELPLAFPVGTQRKYSDLGFTILGQIVEIVSGMPLDEFVKQNIFLPLGMNQTTYNPLKANRDFKIAATSLGNPYEYRMVHDPSLGYQFKEIVPDRWNGWRHYVLKGEVNDGNAWYAESGVSGAAGIFSTVDDLQKLVDMLMNKGKVGTQQFISEKTIATFLTKDKFHNGLGWMMDSLNAFMKNGPAGTFGHTGFTGTSICVVPERKLSIIILINRQQMGLTANKEYYNVNSIREKVFKMVMVVTGE